MSSGAKNSGKIIISSEENKQTKKQFENSDNTHINNNKDSTIDSENISPYFKFFIFSDSGSCIYRTRTRDMSMHNDNDIFEDDEKDNDGIDKDLGAMQGIIQASFFTSLDLNCEIHMIATDIGLLAYKAFIDNNNILLLSLIFPNYYSDETLSHKISQLLLNYIYHFLLMNIGKKLLFKISNSNDVDKLRRIISIYEDGIQYILNNHSSLTFLLKAEKKLQVDKDFIYSVKFYLEKMKK